MNLTLRRRFSDGMQFDINYTLAKSEDMGSQVERGSAFGNFGNGGTPGFLINSFDPELNYGTSDFDVRHQVNTNWLAELPFGQGKRFGGGVGNARQRVHRRLVGGRPDALDQRLPVQRRQLPLVLGDELERAGQRDARRSESAAGNEDGRKRRRRASEPVCQCRRGADLLPAPAAGRSRLRNLFIGDGYFNIDLSLSKSFRLGIADHRLRFRWDVFNVTNAAKFDVGQLTNTPDLAGLGRYNGTLATCDAQAGRCMQFALQVRILMTLSPGSWGTWVLGLLFKTRDSRLRTEDSRPDISRLYRESGARALGRHAARVRRRRWIAARPRLLPAARRRLPKSSAITRHSI